MTQLKQSAVPQPVVTKPVITLEVVPTKTHPVGKKSIQFNVIPITSNPTNTMISLQKSTLMVAIIDVQDEVEIAISADDDGVLLTKDKIGFLFQYTPSDMHII